MRRFLTIFALSLALLPSIGNARTIADLFAIEPGTIFPLLTRTNRLDMVDYYNSGQQVNIGNNLVGESKLLELDSAYLKVQTSPCRLVEMRMRTVGKDTVVTVIETVLTPVPDSRLTQWNVHWQRYTSDKLFKMPDIDDFIVKKMSPEKRADLEAVMIFRLEQGLLRIVQECYPDVKVCCTDAQLLEHFAALQEKRPAPEVESQCDVYIQVGDQRFFVAVFRRSRLLYAASQAADNDNDRTFLLLGIWKALELNAQRDACHLFEASKELQKGIGEYILNID